ncbi:hypothetical protein EMIHUDRAFT_56174, partial [Emiliania huxleyi CCMP1516]|uniref:Fatty acid desaturase domain-containing protein n=2 Tax=Emiliania huxleyi TaxID=2903 RepID=A0A0D3I8E4_EMIH1
CLCANLASHRYFSHHSFRVSRPVQLVLGIASASSGQGGPLWWASNHTEHHRHCDQPHDPHSPGVNTACSRTQLFFQVVYAHVLWMTRRRHLDTDVNNVPQLASHPELWLCDVLWPRLTDAALDLLHNATQAALMPLGWRPDLPSPAVDALPLALHLTMLVNSYCHAWGPSSGCAAIDVPWLAFIGGGAGWHSGHHDDPRCANHGAIKRGPDATYGVICVLETLGLASAVR